MVNPHCVQPDILDRPPPRLQPLDKWQLYARRRRPSAARALRSVLAMESNTSRLPLPRMLAVSLPCLFPAPCSLLSPSSLPPSHRPLFHPLISSSPLPLLPQGPPSKLRLVVVMDLTHDLPAVEEAFEHNVMTISLVNAHSDLSRITYPVFAGGGDAREGRESGAMKREEEDAVAATLASPLLLLPVLFLCSVSHSSLSFTLSRVH